MEPLLERLAALANGHDDVRLETAGRMAGRWLAAMDSDAGHELIAAGLLILAGPFDSDRLAGDWTNAPTKRPNCAASPGRLHRIEGLPQRSSTETRRLLCRGEL